MRKILIFIAILLLFGCVFMFWQYNKLAEKKERISKPISFDVTVVVKTDDGAYLDLPVDAIKEYEMDHFGEDYEVTKEYSVKAGYVNVPVELVKMAANDPDRFGAKFVANPYPET